MTLTHCEFPARRSSMQRYVWHEIYILYAQDVLFEVTGVLLLLRHLTVVCCYCLQGFLLEQSDLSGGSQELFFGVSYAVFLSYFNGFYHILEQITR